VSTNNAGDVFDLWFLDNFSFIVSI